MHKQIFKLLSFYVLLQFSMFLVTKVDAAELCHYYFNGANPDPGKTEQSIIAEFHTYIEKDNQNYIFRTEYIDGEEGYTKTKKIDIGKLQQGKNGSNPSVYIDKNTYDLLNNGQCPKNAYYDTRYVDAFCFDNDGSYCESDAIGQDMYLMKADIYTEAPKDEDNKDNLYECDYEVDTFNAAENKDYKCNIKINIDYLQKVKIFYKNVTDSNYNEFSDYQEYFMCGNDGVYFVNTNLDEPITGRTGFDYLFKSLVTQNNRCPGMNFAAFNGNQYVYLENSFDDEHIFNNGGTQEGKPEDNPNNDINNGPEQDVSNCEIIPTGIIKYIKQALNLIRWISLALVILLGVLDFVKATSADDQDAVKKAWQNFTKRLIAVIILFLLPLLIDFILYIVGLTSGCEFDI